MRLFFNFLRSPMDEMKRTYGCFAVKREKTPKKSKFFFICQIYSKYYNLFRFNINSKNNFFRVSFLSTAKCPYNYHVI